MNDRTRISLEVRAEELERVKKYSKESLALSLIYILLRDEDGFEATARYTGPDYVAVLPLLRLVKDEMANPEGQAGNGRQIDVAGEPDAGLTLGNISGLLGYGRPQDAESLDAELRTRVKESHSDTFASLPVDELRARALEIADKHVALLNTLRAAL